MRRPGSRNDILSGLIFVGLGAAFGIAALGYELGTALRMGPGYFPLVLSGVIALLGGAILIRGLLAAADPQANPVSWRAVILLTGAVIFFGATVRGLGLVGALFGATVLAALASADNTLLRAAAIGGALTALCVAVFSYGLGVTVPLRGHWLGG